MEGQSPGTVPFRKEKEVSKITRCFIFVLATLPLILGGPVLLAKEHGGHAKEHGGKEHGGTPPGWTQGKKVGWEGEGKPPGLLKKKAVHAEKKGKGKKGKKKPK